MMFSSARCMGSKPEDFEEDSELRTRMPSSLIPYFVARVFDNVANCTACAWLINSLVRRGRREGSYSLIGVGSGRGHNRRYLGHELRVDGGDVYDNEICREQLHKEIPSYCVRQNNFLIENLSKSRMLLQYIKLLRTYVLHNEKTIRNPKAEVLRVGLSPLHLAHTTQTPS
jgi:hypothetical protein